MQKIFFEEKLVPTGTYRHDKIVEKPFLESIVNELLKEQVENSIKEYFRDNKDEILLLVDKIVKDGLGKVVMDSINAQFSNAMFNLQSEIQNKLTNY